MIQLACFNIRSAAHYAIYLNIILIRFFSTNSQIDAMKYVNYIFRRPYIFFSRLKWRMSAKVSADRRFDTPLMNNFRADVGVNDGRKKGEKPTTGGGWMWGL